MKAKRIISLLLALMLALGVCLAFAGCGEEEPEETVCTTHVDNDGDGVCDTEGCDETVTPSPAPDAGYFNENGELLLYKNGAPTYQIVLGSDIGALATDVADLLDVLNGLSTSDAKSVPLTDPAQDVEILIGTVSNRGEEYAISKYDLGEKGYMVKQIDTKIVVLGGSSDSLETAIKYLKESVFGIKKTNPAFTDFAMAAAKNYEFVQSGYKVTGVTIGETSLKDYVIASRTSDKTAKAIADELQARLYSELGIRLEIKNSGELVSGTPTIVIRTVENDGASNGFKAYTDESDNLIVECMYSDKFADVATELFDERIFDKKNDVTIASLDIDEDLRNIYYSEFGAKGDGNANDFQAIYDTHAYANKWGHIVNADAGATYYIGNTGGKSAVIMTDVNWGDAEFIFDDSYFTEDDPDEYRTHIFAIRPSESAVTYLPVNGGNAAQQAIYDINAAGGLDKNNFTKLDLGLGRPALLRIVNKNHKNYTRYGINGDTGNDQMELVLVDAEGIVDTSTPLLFDYDEITSITVIWADDPTLTVSGGVITTYANTLPRDYAFYTYRGFGITRSNVVIDGLTHYIEGEGDEGAPYTGFLSISNTNNVRVQNTVLTGHKAYTLRTDANNTMGTYDIGPSSSNNTYFYNVTQTNFFVDVGGKQMISVNNGWWGIMGGNDCKNLTYDTCQLTRFDSHRGTYNATIKNSKVSNITIIGGGKFTLEDSEVYMSSRSMKTLVTLRSDYGATWNGEFYIKNTKAVGTDDYAANNFSIVNAAWDESGIASSKHDFGYDCYMPSKVTLDNFAVYNFDGKTLYDGLNTVYLASGGCTTSNVGTTTINKYIVTKEWYVLNDSAGYKYDCNIESTKFYLNGVLQ